MIELKKLLSTNVIRGACKEKFGISHDVYSFICSGSAFIDNGCAFIDQTVEYEEIQMVIWNKLIRNTFGFASDDRPFSYVSIGWTRTPSEVEREHSSLNVCHRFYKRYVSKGIL